MDTPPREITLNTYICLPSQWGWEEYSWKRICLQILTLKSSPPFFKALKCYRGNSLSSKVVSHCKMTKSFRCILSHWVQLSRTVFWQNAVCLKTTEQPILVPFEATGLDRLAAGHSILILGLSEIFSLGYNTVDNCGNGFCLLTTSFWCWWEI